MMSANRQQQEAREKNVLKTVAILVAAMVIILALFMNKIMTPRYLSDIELKINRLELIDKPVKINTNIEQQWSLVVSSEEQRELAEGLMLVLRDKIRKQTRIVDASTIASQTLPYDQQENIGIIHATGEFVAYLKPPFDQHKMILTYSSLFTHR